MTDIRDILAGFDPDTPLERAETIPARWYTDPAVWELERRAVFAAEWQYVAPAAPLEEPGRYFAVSVAGEPLLIVRGEDGRLRGLANVCRHRASPVVTQPCGKAETLRCPYHGWTYRLDGRLRGAPEMEGVAGFERDSVRLPEVPVKQWGPFVFANLDGRATDAGTDFDLPADLLPRLDRLGVGRLKWVHRATYEVGCNWKVFVDNYLDGGYHVPHLHAGLFSVLDYPKYRTELSDRWNVQVSPMKPAEGETGAVRTGESAEYFWLHPNFMVNCYSGVMDTNRVEPLGPDRCAVVYDFFFTESAETEAGREFVRRSVAVAEQVQEEDRGICEAVQRGLRSRFFDTGRFSVRRENGAHQFHSLLGRRLRAAAGG
jgi:choline monooxygenase